MKSILKKVAGIVVTAIFALGMTGCNHNVIEDSYNWYETPVDFVTGKAATADSEYVLFGVFPKTVLPLDSTVTVDEEDFVEMGSNTYFKGSDGEYYAKALENANGTGAEYKYENKVEQVKQKSTGSYRYFKVEPIKWRVLTTTYDIDGEAGSATGALLLAEDILTANVPYYESNENRTIDGNTVYPNNYKYSQIRAYLNGLTYQGQSGEITKWNGNGFLQTAFTKAAQGKIVTTTVDNSGDSTTDATGSLTKADGTNTSYPTDYTCEPTEDKIFLLSEREVTTTAYGYDSYNIYGPGNARIKIPTDYAKANYAFQSSTDGYGGYWWLRSPYYFITPFASSVRTDGRTLNRNVDSSEDGVVPALTISF